MRFLTLVLLCTCLAGCNQSGSTPGKDHLDVVFGSAKVSIPLKYVLPGLPSSMVPTGEGLDIDGGISIKVPLQDLGIGISENKDLSGNIIVLLSNSAGHIYDAMQLRPDALDAWTGRGLYKNRIIEFDIAANLYRVYPSAGYPVIWQYFKDSPEDRVNPVPIWISSCTSPPGTNGKALRKVTCTTVSRYKTIESQISFAGENIRSIDAITKAYRALLADWDRTDFQPTK